MKRNCAIEEPLVFEALEPRLLLAGDVTFSVVKDLVLVGDGSDNAVVIDSPGQDIIRVTGVGGTTINGEASVSAGWMGGMDISMLQGNNDIEINGVECNKNIVIETGSGRDTIDLEDTTVHGKTSISTGAGPDTITIDPSTFNGKVTIVTGDGDDTIEVQATNPGTVFNGKVSFNTGAGADEINLGQVTLNGKVKALFGDGADWLYLTSCDVNGGLSANMGKDNSIDGLAFSGNTWSRKLSVKTGGGDDDITIEGDEFGTRRASVKIDTGDGADEVSITEGTINGKLSLKMGDGADLLVLGDTSIAGAVKTDGGKGTDTYQDDGGISLPGNGTLTFKSFEVFA